MKKLLHELFYIPKYGKMSEKAFMRQLCMSISMIVVCLCAMAFTAYAYYASDVSVNTQTIQTTVYRCDITVDGETYSGLTGGTTIEVKLAAGTRKIKIAHLEEDSAKTGFLVLNIGGIHYHTQQVGWDGEKYVPSLEFTLELETEQTVCLMPHWGTSSHYDVFQEGLDNELYIKNGATLNVAAKQVLTEPDMDLEEETDPTDSTPPSETPGEAEQPTDPTEPSEPVVPEQTEPTEPTEPEEVLTYRVQAGDTLYTIADMFGLDSWKILQAYNNLPDKTIYEGDVLLIPPEDYEIPRETTTDSTEEASSDPEATT